MLLGILLGRCAAVIKLSNHCTQRTARPGSRVGNGDSARGQSALSRIGTREVNQQNGRQVVRTRPPLSLGLPTTTSLETM